MYFIDFIEHVFRKKNIPIIIYLVGNVILIAFFIENFLNKNWNESIIFSLLFYFVSLVIALSPIGEYILRLQTGCKKIRRKDFANFIMPIFEDVYSKAREKDPSLPTGIQLFMTNDETVNAFATGRKTICITKGLLNESEEVIKAIIGHEMGHLANKDTDLILVVSIGNYLITALFIGIRLIARVFVFMGSIGSIIAGELAANLGVLVSGFLVDIILVLLMKAWTKVGMLLVMKSSRSQEYEADIFSAELGYGTALCEFSDEYTDAGFNGLFATLMSTHPDNDLRIANLQENGVSYFLER